MVKIGLKLPGEGDGKSRIQFVRGGRMVKVGLNLPVEWGW